MAGTEETEILRRQEALAREMERLRRNDRDHGTIAAARGVTVYQNRIGRQIDDPELRDARLGIQRQLDRAVEVQAAVRHLHKQENVARPRVVMRVAEPGAADQGEVQLRLRPVVQHHRLLAADPCPAGEPRDQQLVQVVGDDGMAWTDRGHIDHLPFQELDAIVLGQDSCRAHAVVAPAGTGDAWAPDSGS